MTRFARWFVLLGVATALPAAILLGSGIGELLRRPALGFTGLVEREAVLIGLAVASVFLIRTADGLRHEQSWALYLGLGLAVLVGLAGFAGLVVGGALLESMGMARQLVLGTVPLSLAALLLGARLTVGLWGCTDLALPFGWQDVGALGALGGVLAMAAASHLLVRGFAG